MPSKNRRKQNRRSSGTTLRIIGGQFRGHAVLYDGDAATRPMKDRLREAVFNLLGPAVRNSHAIDLFAGTGAIAFEALSRGAARATLVERRFPAVRLIQQNASSLGVEDRCRVVRADTFLWLATKDDPTATLKENLAGDAIAPWMVFCSPPYDFYVHRQQEMLHLIGQFEKTAPKESALVVEADDRFEFSHLPRAADWDVRRYRPAVVGILWT